MIFCVIGIFIPGLTAIGLIGLQILFTKIGLECPDAWILIWSTTITGSLIVPIIFYRYIRVITKPKAQKLKNQITFFNLFQYTLIQAGLSSLFTDGETLCYGSGGQNGLELVFTAWLSLPILISLSLMFNFINSKNIASNSD